MDRKELAKELGKLRDVSGLTSAIIDAAFECREEIRLYSHLKRLFYIAHREQISNFNKTANQRVVDSLRLAINDKRKKDDAFLAFFYFYHYILEFIFSDIERLDFTLEKIEKTVSESWVDELNPQSVSVARCIVEGLLHSNLDRAKAHSLFQMAIERGGHLIEHFQVDLGVFTFFENSEVKDNDSRFKDVLNGEVLTHRSAMGSKMTFVLSLDSRFLKIYGPTLLPYIAVLSDYDFYLNICGIDAKVSANSFYGLSRTYERFTGCTIMDRLSISCSKVPVWVVEEKTFFACARFFSAYRLLSVYEEVYIMDADLTITQDVEPYLNAQRKFDFSISFSRGMAKSIPWRRYLAGNVYANRQASDIIHDVCGYLLKGLSMSNSWMLDQNALSFIMEKDWDLVIGDNAKSAKPFSQFQIRQLLERKIR